MKKIRVIPVVLFPFFIFTLGTSNCVEAQDIPNEPDLVIRQQLEDLTAANEDVETEDDSYLQSMQHFLKEPINLNNADAGLLEQLNILSPIQIKNLLSYRNVLGNFLNIYELQAVPAWDLNLIRRIRPFITVSQKLAVFETLNQRLKDGNHTLLFRTAQTLEKAKGSLLDSNQSKNFYPGSPQKLLLRYKYKSGNQLQYGFTAEKDAGEQFFRGAQKNGFDFYSAHFFIRNLGVIKSLAMGDFSVNMGQGLTQWQSLAFNKGGDIINAIRQSDILKPYNSAGEINYNRGIGITLKKKNWETTGFVSHRKMDAAFNVDTINQDSYVSSLQSSGYHRTSNEIAGKGSQGQLSFGGNITYTTERFHVGANAVHYDFEHPIKKSDFLYNIYSLSGTRAGNYSIDYGYTYKNMHLFGEVATDENLDKAVVSGLLINMDSKVSMSFLYRNISKAYQSLYANAFTENTNPTNESGLYSGITINPSSFLRIDAYADFYHFPWLKYRTDAPTSGNDYMLQFTYQPNKEVMISTRYRYENKPINYNPNNIYFNPVTGRPKQGLRTQFNYKLNPRISIRSRIELAWFDKKGEDPQNGFLTYVDFIYKPAMNIFSGNLRFSYFETDGYESRLYAFENDVLYGYSIPVFFDKGYRYYINGSYKVLRRLSFWTRFSQTIYKFKNAIGSGLDIIKGNKKSEIKLQIIYEF